VNGQCLWRARVGIAVVLSPVTRWQRGWFHWLAGAAGFRMDLNRAEFEFWLASKIVQARCSTVGPWSGVTKPSRVALPHSAWLWPFACPRRPSPAWCGLAAVWPQPLPDRPLLPALSSAIASPWWRGAGPWSRLVWHVSSRCPPRPSAPTTS
jgi:hypothetical protein